MPTPTFCIIGAGLAGGQAAFALRDRGYDGRLILIGDEPEPPYERPPLSKGYLSGQLAQSKIFLRPDQAYIDRAIEWRSETRVTEIDRHERRIRLADGELISFERLLLATGAAPRRLDLPGADLAGVTTYRTLADSESLKASLVDRPRLVVVGGGFLGSELAAAARRQGCPVTILEVGDAFLSQLGPLVGDFCADLHRQAGVEILLGETVTRFLGSPQLEAIELASGRRLPCDLALVCVGVEPNSDLAVAAGLETDPGVLVDEHCQSSLAGVFAAGDVASWWSARWQRRLRVEHYDNAHQQGLFVAGAILGDIASYDPVPYFWTEQYETTVQQVGIVSAGEAPLVRGDPATGRFSLFQVHDGLLSSCVTVNRFPDLAAARRLMNAGARIPPGILTDPDVDLRSWSQAAAEQRTESR
jgi:3-phenylpropionate/trans-cinnamate dioxygenase ferredoxin reductase subunit